MYTPTLALPTRGFFLRTGAPGTNCKPLHCLRAMSTSLRQQFEAFADCCLELARRAETPARRSRLVKMAHEYRQATALVSVKTAARQDNRADKLNSHV